MFITLKHKTFDPLYVHVEKLFEHVIHQSVTIYDGIFLPQGQIDDIRKLFQYILARIQE